MAQRVSKASVQSSGGSRNKPDAARRRLIRLRLDLHDGPMQDLAAAGFALSGLQRELDSLPDDTTAASAQLDTVRRLLGGLEQELRAIVTDGADEDTGGIVDLVREEIARFEQRSSAQVLLDVSGDVEPATDSQRIALQRVLREALTNVGRHAEATEVRVELFEADEVVYLRVRDNGKGCDTASTQHDAEGRPRFGLSGMRERLELLDGSLSFASRVGGPTTVTAGVKRWRPRATRLAHKPRKSRPGASATLKALTACDDE